MKSIELDYVEIKIVDDRVVYIRAREGVEVDAEKSRYANNLIQDEMPGPYGMIIDRKEDYSIVPVDVYEVLNGFEKLKAIAIVIYKETSAPNVAIEEYLFNGRMKLFSDVEEAEAWLRTVVEPS